MKANINKILFSLLVLTFMSSCSDEGYADYDPGSSSTQRLDGEWFVDITDADGNLLVGHALHKTYSDSEGNLTLSDRIAPGSAATSFSGWWLVTNVDYDLDNLTFSASGAENSADGSIVNITEGKILKNAAISPTGAVVDSIYFKGEFDYDPGNVLIFSGRKRTGFLEEE